MPSTPSSKSKSDKKWRYTKRQLVFYDPIVTYFSLNYIWRCSRNVTLDLYAKHLGTDHLEVGPGTGWHLTHADLSHVRTITLADSSEGSLEHSLTRIRHPNT